MCSLEEIVTLVEKQINSITSATMREHLRRLLVPPTVHFRDWQYAQNQPLFHAGPSPFLSQVALSLPTATMDTVPLARDGFRASLSGSVNRITMENNNAN